MKKAKQTIELLAPARDYDTARAAVDYGADALYMGGPRFGARYAAGNSIDDLARAVEYAHRYGVRVHCTLNTIIYDEELREAERTAREVIAAGVDALIVQDLAFRRMDLPPVELHASTQMCNMSPEWVRFLGECGFSRVILERALTRAEIQAIRAATDVELECFVHGAICVGHSGRCMLSRTMSSRSGNRGECSQPCRLTYDLKSGDGRKLIAGKHLLSVRDLDLSSHIGQMIDDGICSFKVEGRLKDISYIKNVVAYYRRRIDEELAVRPQFCRSSLGESIPDFTPDPAKSFTRGESSYMYEGKRAGVASFDTPKAVGEYLGRVARADAKTFTLDRSVDLAPGDGLCFISDGALTGTNVNQVDARRVTPNKMEGITRGAEVYRNFDQRFRLSLDRSRTRRVIPTSAKVRFDEDGVVLQYIDCEGYTGEARLTESLDVASNLERMEQTLREQAVRSGDTIFRVDHVQIEGEVRFVPLSKLGVLRREALERLNEERLQLRPEHNYAQENRAAQLPEVKLDGHWNIVNRLSEQFYRDHGATHIERGLDAQSDLHGERVLLSSYCLRRELGECLREGSKLRDPLYIEHGAFRYRLEFDCKRCRMNLIYEE